MYTSNANQLSHCYRCHTSKAETFEDASVLLPGVKGLRLFIRILERFVFGLVEAWFISGSSNSQENIGDITPSIAGQAEVHGAPSL